jgi:hypothetical protein
MSRQFIKNKPVISFVIFSSVCIGLDMAVIRTQANSQIQVEISSHNPHHLPNEFNPNLNWVEHKAKVISAAKEGVAEEGETMHAIAMRGNKSLSGPIYDYTTGTSN